MLLRDALGVTRGDMVSLIGAGGKTTTLFRLAKELRDLGGKVMVTTTTKVFKPAKPHIDRLFIVDDVQALVDVCAEIAAPAIIGAGCAVDGEGNLLGMPTPWLDRLNQDGGFDAILVEADGAASRFLNIPSDKEPIIPESCQATVWMVAIKILGKPLTDEWVHCAARARDLLGLPAGARIDEEVLLQLLQHKNGCLKGIPIASRKLALINQADSAAEMAAAQALGERLHGFNFAKVVITSYASAEPIIRGIAD